jgi:hypothetical protein
LTVCVNQHTSDNVLGVITLLLSLGSSTSFSTPIDDAFTEYLQEMEPAYKRLQEMLQTDIVAAWQHPNFARKEIADKTVFLAKITRDTYWQIQRMNPLDDQDDARKELILKELLERNAEWISAEMPGNIPLTLSCFSVPVRTSQYFVENQGEDYADLFSEDNKVVRTVAKTYLGVVAFIIAGTPVTAACFIVAPFYDAAYYSGYEPIQNYQADLKTLTKPYIIETQADKVN